MNVSLRHYLNPKILYLPLEHDQPANPSQIVIEFTLQYKGSRNYLQGGDLYNAIDNRLSARLGGHLLRLAFKSFARHQCQLHLERPPQGEKVLGEGLWGSADGQRLRFWLVETAQPVTDSYPFDEDAITSSATLDGATIRGSHNNAYSVIENVIALTKRLNYALTPDIHGKWLFGQLDLTDAFPTNWTQIEIERLMCLANSFSRNRIAIDGVTYGEMRFIVGEL